MSKCWRLFIIAAGLGLSLPVHSLLLSRAMAGPLPPAMADHVAATPKGQARFAWIGEADFPTGYRFQDTEVGGLSGITYAPAANCFYAISDDRSRINPARFYSLTIDLKDGRLDPGDIVFTHVTVLRDEKGKAFERNRIDPEGIAVTTKGDVYISSEGDAGKGIGPAVFHFDTAGRLIRRLRVPEKYKPSTCCGIRNNLAFESLAITPDQRYLYTAVENALLQDGPKTDDGQQSPSRILKFDLKTGAVAAEFIYMVAGASPAARTIFRHSSNGLAELLAANDGDALLALERGFSIETGVAARLYQVTTRDASNVAAEFSLLQIGTSTVIKEYQPVRKTEVANLNKLVPKVDNLEGMTFGPLLPDGRRTLIMVSDNNFSSAQTTQFIALAVEIDPGPR